MQVYLDNQASTPVDARVIEKIHPFMAKIYGNPHSDDHYFGWESRKAIQKSREKIAFFLKCDPDEIIFTSGATEANNLVIIGLLPALKLLGKHKILVSEIEHKCVLECASFARRQGFEVNYLKPSKEGFIDQYQLKNLMDNKVGLVSVMSVNNEIGTIQPIEELCEITHNFGAIFHTDAAQGALFIDLNLKKSGIDLLSISSHKIYGPKGIGCVFIQREIQKIITPLLYGGGQQNGLRPGTLPTALCVGFGEACELVQTDRKKNIKTLDSLSNLFWRNLIKGFPKAKLNGSKDNRHPGNLNIQFPGIDAHALLQLLQPYVAASSGSACNTGNIEPSYVLKAIGLSENSASSSIRFSFGIQNNNDQIIYAVEKILSEIKNLSDSSVLSKQSV